MTRYGHFIRLIVLASLVMVGLFLTALVSALLLLMNGASLQDLMEMGQVGTDGFTSGITRILLLAQHILTFIGPGLAFGFIFFKPEVMKGFKLDKAPTTPLIILGTLFLLVAYPLVNLSFKVNEIIPLPSWAFDFESQAEETLRAILTMNSPIIFILNLIIIAILPGIGEELIFRGILQKELGSIFKSPILAIWISAFIFSAVHLQFEGLLPRMVLGVVLGYLFYWTQNLWVPIIAHACNNGFQVALIYFTDMDISQVDEQSSEQLEWWMIVLSVGVMFLIAQRLIPKTTPTT